MKVKMRVLLNGKTTKRVEQVFRKTIEVEISRLNFGTLLKGSFEIGKKPNVHIVKLGGYDPITNILHGTSQAPRLICRGYRKDLVADGWRKVSSLKK